jgi:hypothetical protein
MIEINRQSDLSRLASEPTAWRRMLWRYGVACAVIAMLAAIFVIVLDPYDSGRFSSFDGHGVPSFGQRLTAASLARAPDTQAAIIGNSTVQLIDPARLAELTGPRFVSLAIPATGPIEQLAVARWLVRHHDGVSGPVLQALVIGLDARWCQGGGQLDVRDPFPFWLYGDSGFAYVRGLLNLRGVEAAERKVKLTLGIEKRLHADGYRDFEPELARNETAAAADFAEGNRGFDAAGGDTLDAVARLRDFLAGVPATTSLVLVFVPRYSITLPAPGSPAGQRSEACKAAFRQLAAGRPHTAIVDFLKDGEIARDRRNFWDRVHYRKPIAHLIEDEIAAALRAVAGA